MNFNYSELLAFDRATSITFSGNEATRKLSAWANRLTSTDYPASWTVDLLDGTIETLTLDSTLPHVWSSDNFTLTIGFTAGTATSYQLDYGDYQFLDTKVNEGYVTLVDEENQIRVNICDPTIRQGEKSARITFVDISRSAACDEMDSYVYSRLNRLEDEIIKGNELVGVWRLAGIVKEDSDKKDTISVSLIYKEGYAKTLNFDEAIVLSKDDYKTKSSQLVVKFDNLDPRYVESAKATYLAEDSILSPVFGGVPYDGYWYNIKMKTSEVKSSGDADDAAYVLWFLNSAQNTDLYFHYQADSNTIKGHLFKWDTTEELIREMLNETGFLSNGHQIEFYTELGSAAEPEALRGKVYWYKPHLDQVNGEDVYYDESDTYAKWHNGTTWVFSAVADVGGSPTDYFKLIEYPDTITVSGSGDSAADGEYSFTIMLNGKPTYASSLYEMIYLTGAPHDGWNIQLKQNSEERYWAGTVLDLPPKTGWTAELEGGYWPAPTLAYTNTQSAYVAFGAWSGTLTLTDGAGGYNTLNDEVAGRTTIQKRTSRDPENLLLDWEMEIVWSDAQNETFIDYGNYYVSRSLFVYRNYSTAPSTSGWENPKYDDTNGQHRYDYELTGPNGTGAPTENSNGTYDYAVLKTTISCKDTYWHISALKAVKPEKTKSRTAFSAVQIRQRLGGEVAHEVDDSGRLVGVDWNLDWDLAPQSAFEESSTGTEDAVTGARWWYGSPAVYYRAIKTGTSKALTNTEYYEVVTEFADNQTSYPSETAPANWVTGGYQSRYGDWQSHWTKGYLMGEGSLLLDDGTARICKGPFQQGARYVLGDVVYDPVTESFKVLSGGDLWEESSEAPIGIQEMAGSGSGGSTSLPSEGYGEGVVKQSGNEIYTCKGDGWYTYRISSDSTGGYAFNATNRTHPPESELGKMFWEKGIVGAATLATTSGTWSDFDANLVKSKIAISGVGEAPFEQPDLHIEIKQELQREVLWNTNWEWKAYDGGDGKSYDAGYIVLDLSDGNLYENDTGTNTDTAPSSDATNWSIAGAGSNPTGWDSTYQDQYGDWQDSWAKGFRTGAGSILSESTNGKICRGAFDTNTVYRVGDVVATAESISAPAFYVVTGAPALNQWTEAPVAPIDDSLSSYIAGEYENGNVVESGGEVFTCKGEGHHVYATASGLNYYATNSTHPPESALGQIFWSRGAKESGTPASPTNLTWASFSAALVQANIATSGSGVEPFEATRKLSVFNDDGIAALSASARYAFYNNIAANPQWVEVWECLVRYFQSLELRTYFAVNPHWIAAGSRRIPQTATSRQAVKTFIEALTVENSTLFTALSAIDIDAVVSNLEVDFTFQPVGDLWVAVAAITLFTNWEPDTETLGAMVENLEQPHVGCVSGSLAMLAYDFTGALQLPWGDKKFLDVS